MPSKKALDLLLFDGMLDGTVDGMLDGTFDGMLDGTFDGMLDGTFDGTLAVEAMFSWKDA